MYTSQFHIKPFEKEASSASSIWPLKCICLIRRTRETLAAEAQSKTIWILLALAWPWFGPR